MRLNILRAAPAVALLIIATSCSRLSHLDVKPEGTYTFSACAPNACTDTVALTYIGVGGVIIRHGTHALMTGPSFTRPNPAQLLLPMQSDSALVRQTLQRFDTTGIRATLVGHAHYDHLMDMPSVMRLLPSVHLYGSPTTRHVLAGDATVETTRVTAIDTLRAGSATRVGDWYYVTDANTRRRFRIMAVVSTHAPNVGDYTISNDTLRANLPELPRLPWMWPKGEVYAYLIDVLRDDGQPVFRVYYQDSASDPEHSVMPRLHAADVRPVDLAIICAGNFSNAKNYPSTLLGQLKPRFALVGHWENFFRGVNQSLQVVPGIVATDLRQQLRDSLGGEWATLRPFSVAQFPFAAR